MSDKSSPRGVLIFPNSDSENAYYWALLYQRRAQYNKLYTASCSQPLPCSETMLEERVSFDDDFYVFISRHAKRVRTKYARELNAF